MNFFEKGHQVSMKVDKGSLRVPIKFILDKCLQGLCNYWTFRDIVFR